MRGDERGEEGRGGDETEKERGGVRGEMRGGRGEG